MALPSAQKNTNITLFHFWNVKTNNSIKLVPSGFYDLMVKRLIFTRAVSNRCLNLRLVQMVLLKIRNCSNDRNEVFD